MSFDLDFNLAIAQRWEMSPISTAYYLSKKAQESFDSGRIESSLEIRLKAAELFEDIPNHYLQRAKELEVAAILADKVGKLSFKAELKQEAATLFEQAVMTANCNSQVQKTIKRAGYCYISAADALIQTGQHREHAERIDLLVEKGRAILSKVYPGVDLYRKNEFFTKFFGNYERYLQTINPNGAPVDFYSTLARGWGMSPLDSADLMKLRGQASHIKGEEDIALKLRLKAAEIFGTEKNLIAQAKILKRAGESADELERMPLRAELNEQAAGLFELAFSSGLISDVDTGYKERMGYCYIHAADALLSMENGLDPERICGLAEKGIEILQRCNPDVPLMRQNDFLMFFLSYYDDYRRTVIPSDDIYLRTDSSSQQIDL